MASAPYAGRAAREPSNRGERKSLRDFFCKLEARWKGQGKREHGDIHCDPKSDPGAMILT